MLHLLSYNELKELESKVDILISNNIEEKWINVDSACRLLDLSKTELNNKIRSGKIGYSTIGSTKFLRKSELMIFKNQSN
jgi:hypothetical protein